MPCQSDAAIKAVKKSCERLNAYICERATFDDNIKHLASPLTGCGFGVDRYQKLFLLQYRKGKRTADKIADSVWKILSRTNTTTENFTQIKNLAETFLTKELLIFKALLIA